ncbi:uncharacterized protein ARMOST_06203 [Armillaria ostoyae]|uniref:DUF6534 domain-containing protein n=1 Tax=Armillaria ostoyae TaxID=47428 RepID=A0A284R2C7_ARMOS|nr:uncharacterized protein ARMOST_06203 [Armillaria ostoyae]
MVNLSYTLGSLLLGGLFSATLTGMMSVQSLLYFKLFPKDKPRIKALVTILWLLDVAHSATVWAGLWNYLIIHFDDTARMSQIPQAISVGLSQYLLSPTHHTAKGYHHPHSTSYFEYYSGHSDFIDKRPSPPFLSTCSSLSEYFGVRTFLIPIHQRSFNSYSKQEQLDTRSVDCHPRCSPPSLCLWYASFQFPPLSRFNPSSQLAPEQCTLSIETYSGFKDKFDWVFSAGLGLSSAVDILITGSLLKLLHATRKSSLSFDHIIDSLILYTLECGAVTCAATIASMICWLTMNNLVFLGLHFVISKLYSNSLLATLITRYELRNSRDRSTSDGIVDLDMFNMRRVNILTPGTSFNQPMQVSVKQSVIQYGPDGSTEAEI